MTVFNISRIVRIKRFLVSNRVSKAISRPVASALKVVTRGFYMPGLTSGSIEFEAKRVASNIKVILTPESIFPISVKRSPICKNFLASFLPEAEITLDSYSAQNVAKLSRAIRWALFRIKSKYKNIEYKGVIQALLQKIRTPQEFKEWEKDAYLRFRSFADTMENQEEPGRTRFLAGYRNVILIMILKSNDRTAFVAWDERVKQLFQGMPPYYIYVLGVLLKKTQSFKDFIAWERDVKLIARKIAPSKIGTFLKALETARTIDDLRSRLLII